jgi:hypothetical protein
MVSCGVGGGDDSVGEASFGGVDELFSKQTSVFYRLSRETSIASFLPLSSHHVSAAISTCLRTRDSHNFVSLSVTSRTFGKNMGSFAPWYPDIGVDTVL